MSFPVFPLWFIDVFGSFLMILFGILCVLRSLALHRKDPQNVVWAYLLWLSMALVFFAFSRSIGHIAQHVLTVAGYSHVWEILRPYSGSLNTIAFIVGGSVTLFFERIWGIYHQIIKDRETLKDAHRQLTFINRHLDELVREKTRELISSERKYRRLFESAQEVIAVVSHDGSIVDMNPAGLKLFGLSLDNIESENFKNFFYDMKEFDRLRNRLEKEGAVTNWECAIKNPHGEKKLTMLISGAREVEQVERYVLWLRDITQRKFIEQQLLHTDKLSSIGRLAAGIAHEINNPLGIILGYTQLLLRSEPPDSERYSDLKTIEKHVRMCKTIVGDLLKFSRMTPTEKQPGDIHDVIDEVLTMLHHHLEGSGIVVEKDFDRSVPGFSFDSGKMKQVFINMLMNARDAIGSYGGRISIRTRFIDNSLRICIEDDGAGISSEQIHKIFEPFYTTKPPGKGTGLGLSVSYGIIADHGGNIFVESTEGKGTTFTIVIPIYSSND